MDLNIGIVITVEKKFGTKKDVLAAEKPGCKRNEANQDEFC